MSDIENDGWAYTKIVRVMYCFPQAGKISNHLLKKRLDWAGYYATQFTPVLWRHVWRPLTFTLAVDDFGVRFEGDSNANHLVKTLERYYDITVDWKGEL